MLNTLSKTWVLVSLFIATLAIGYSFSFAQDATGGLLLDMLGTGEEAKARLSEMSPDQKTAHFWATVLNDTAYPLAYGGLFIGLIWRFSGQLRQWLILPAVAVIVADLAENTTQALALAGNDSLIGLKDILTPAKFGLFALAAVMVLLSFGLALARRFRPKTDTSQA
ncbi:MAG: hypothetical protein AAFV37_02165 [Pseudomonadota bacterium]